MSNLSNAGTQTECWPIEASWQVLMLSNPPPIPPRCDYELYNDEKSSVSVEERRGREGREEARRGVGEEMVGEVKGNTQERAGVMSEKQEQEEQDDRASLTFCQGDVSRKYNKIKSASQLKKILEK
eukprot:185602-Hanusia_phi.AAC.1